MKKKKNYTFLWVIIGIVIGIGIISMITNQPDITSTGEWQKALNSSEKQIIYLGRPSCSWCSKFKPGLDNLSEQYNIEYVYVNTDAVSQSELNQVFDALDIDSKEFGTPYTAIVQNGKKLAEQPGYISEADLFKFLQEYGFIGEDKTYAPNEKTVELE
jgi:predicted bacteriocin transport accessory protein